MSSPNTTFSDVAGIELLTQACQACDRAEALAAHVGAKGEIVRTPTGIKAHPAIKKELARRGFIVRTLQKLGLNSVTIIARSSTGERLMSEFPYVYLWDRKDRKGQFCRVLVRGKMNSCCVEFEDGYTMVTSRNALRRRENESAA